MSACASSRRVARFVSRHRLCLCPVVDQREGAEDVPELVGGQAVDVGDCGLEFGVGRVLLWRGGPKQSRGKVRDSRIDTRIRWRPGHRQPRHDAGGHVGGHTQADEVVRHEAVEDAAQELLVARGEGRLQAEQGVHGDAAGGTMAAISVSRFVALATSR